MKKIGFIVIIFSLISTSCIREEIISTPISASEAVLPLIYGTLSPGDSIHIYLGLSIALGEEKQGKLSEEQIEKTVILLIDSTFNHRIILSYLPNKAPKWEDSRIWGISQIDFPIHAGHTYEVNIQIPGFDPVTASTRVPKEARPFSSVSFEADTNSWNGGLAPGYDVFAQWEGKGDHEYHLVYEYVSRKETIFEPFEERYSFGSGLHSPDLYRKVQNTFSVELFILGAEQNPNFLSKPERLGLVLLTSDIHFFKYASVADFFDYQNFNLDTDSFLELDRGVLPQYTNIENGLGVFGSYLTHTYEILP